MNFDIVYLNYFVGLIFVLWIVFAKKKLQFNLWQFASSVYNFIVVKDNNAHSDSMSCPTSLYFLPQGDFVRM